MISDGEKIRAAIAEQAGEWLVANDEGSLDARDSAALTEWLKTSPVHVEEFLGVSAIARDLREARADPEYCLEAILARAKAEDDSPVRHLWPRVLGAVRGGPSRRQLIAAVTMAGCATLSVGLLWWNLRPVAQPLDSGGTTALHFNTGHGEQLNRRLADNSVLHMNTDSAVTIRYGKTERLVMLTAGQAAFEVAHESDRAFRVLAGPAEVVDIGTQFDVRLDHDSTVVTVVEGRVAVRPAPMAAEHGANSNPYHGAQSVRLGANQQISVTEGAWPATPIIVDAQNTTAWLRREIVFNDEPLERVAAEFNRYAPKPIEIATPALRNLPISGIFATDDTEAFVAFLRSLKDVEVDVTPTRIRVSRH